MTSANKAPLSSDGRNAGAMRPYRRKLPARIPANKIKVTKTWRTSRLETETKPFRVVLTVQLKILNGPHAGFVFRNSMAHNAGDSVSAFTVESTKAVHIVTANCV